ncbi:hypothetical protein PVAND_016004 [Polypedilum vanderplanki]|uniref:Nonsense-mediated mRNA decay factor SMG8 n=1 Tax=Polypedilum vanderplanki TaxID=319348 RepID=A0A9J6BEK5_POLVA|nr:hypothetical protein PVAND_016004 [Polypedilum vanderplanki]
MDNIKSCTFPKLSDEFNELFNDSELKLIICGVIGKSNLPNCNKMKCFDLFNCHSVFLGENEEERVENRIKFYYEKGGKIIYVHFETSFDIYIACDLIKKSESNFFLPTHSELRTSFARMLLFATQICHILILVEPSGDFDASYLSIFKTLKIIREKYLLKFLPKLLKNTSIWNAIAKEFRLCSPRVLFYFEKLSRPVEDITAYEIEKEDQIYQMLRANFIITNNANLSLFSIPKNKKFLFINNDEKINSDPVIDSLDFLLQHINSNDKDENEIYPMRPYRGYAINYFQDEKTKDYEEKQRTFVKLLNEHVDEALNSGFDDSIAKYKNKNHFVRPSCKTWYEIFKFMHKVLIENATDENFEAKDQDYKIYLDNFFKILDIDQQLFSESSNHGYDLATLNYSELLPHHYSKNYHESKLNSALEIFYKYARGPEREILEQKLKENCDSIWTNGRQQCEINSLRGNPCILISKHATNEGSSHSSGVILISVCNCGKTQGRREDPYTIRKANYEFYQMLATSCSVCEKSTKIDFPVSLGKSKATSEIPNKNLMSLIMSEIANKTPNEEKTSDNQLHLSASQKTQESESDLSLRSNESSEDENKNENEADMNEIVVEIGKIDIKEEHEASTTEYLPGMILSASLPGIFPQFPSWSLVCIGSSSIYSHNTGLTESQQPGFLSSTNYLLPWDVRVRLEHAKTWAENYEKNRSRKKLKQLTTQNSSGTFFTLKIFVGMEYECGRGHRFMMDTNQTVLRGSKSCASKIVFSNMPIYFPCPCRQNSVAQLLRVHLVTPKAPVNITLDPKVKIRRETEMIFVTGWNEPVKLSQSAYWILRLPYVYQGGDDDPVPVPFDVPNNSEALRYGFLMEGMFGIKEDESGVMNQ